MSRTTIIVAALLALAACGRGARPAKPEPTDTAPSPSAPFTPGTTSADRRARIASLSPALDKLFQAKFEESGATGLAVGLIVDGEPVYQRGIGVRDVASGAPVDAHTVFRLASLTKSFTALAVLKLRDEGKVSLDLPVTTYLPELRALVAPTRDAPPITLRLLLSNASGLSYDDLWGAVTFGKSEAELNELLGSGVQFTSTPAMKYAYSNLGWALLGRVVERVSGRSYRDYVTTNILQPLGMTSTVWEPADVAPGRLATGYHHAGTKLVAEPRMSEGAFAPAGGLYTSLNDYARYAAYNLAAYPPRDEPESGPVRRSTLREMHEGQRWARGGDKDAPVVRRTDDGLVLGAGAYGFGWLNVTSCTEEGRVQHGGFGARLLRLGRARAEGARGVRRAVDRRPRGHRRALRGLQDLARRRGHDRPGAGSRTELGRGPDVAPASPHSMGCRRRRPHLRSSEPSPTPGTRACAKTSHGWDASTAAVWPAIRSRSSRPCTASSGWRAIAARSRSTFS